MNRIMIHETAQFLNKGLLSQEVQELIKLTLARLEMDSRNYFTVVKKGVRDNIIVTDGNGIVLEFSPIVLKHDLDEDFWIIIDDFRSHPANGVQINFLLPKEY